jgi:hypothetical protein
MKIFKEVEIPLKCLQYGSGVSMDEKMLYLSFLLTRHQKYLRLDGAFVLSFWGSG